MTELLGSIDCDFEGKILQFSDKSLEKESQEIKDLIRNVLYIIQDIASIKAKLANTGSFVKIKLRNTKSHFEAAVGSSSIRINHYLNM